MLDPKFIRENADKIKEAAKAKKLSVDVDHFIELDEKRRELTTKSDELRAKRNELAKSAQGGRPSPEQIEAGKKLKDDIAAIEKDLLAIEEEWNAILVKMPTIPAEDTPAGTSDKDNVEIFRSAEPTRFDFEPRSHIELGQLLDIIDMERGAKVAGYRGYYLKNEGVSLVMALMLFALNKLIQKGFTPFIPPTLVKEFALFGSGYFNGTKYNPEVDEIYKIENAELMSDGSQNAENKFLVGTAEPVLLAYHSDEILEEKDLPIRYCGFSQCYRSEIGSYGKDVKGMYRVHEFMKVEQVCLTTADITESDKLHLEMVEISKELHADLGLPYRVLHICSGDMSAGKYKMFDLEAWMPSRNGWGETGSASNFVDWQARRLNVRYRTKAGEIKPVYMLNNTALPSVRPLIAVLENFQQADGSVIVPEVLRPYMPGQMSIIKPRKA